jgi:hypothetical protein
VAETTVKSDCEFQRTGKTMGEVYQCYVEKLTFFLRGSNIIYFMFYIHF